MKWGTLFNRPQELAIKIAVIAHIRHAIAEPFMGGMESHCHGLVAGLEQRGHDVTLFAAHGSQATSVFPICAEPCETIYPRIRFELRPQLLRYQIAAFTHAWDAIAGGAFDVVHNNSLFPDLIAWAERDSIAMVTSQHVPPFGRMRDYVEASFGDGSRQLTVTSEHQKLLWTADEVSTLNVVHNGVNIIEWCPAPERHERLIWFGRISETKGLRETVQAARRAEKHLDIIGTVEDPLYFATYVEPYLDGNIRYLGHLSGQVLRNTVAAARAVIVTPMWDEPFGLVAAEALASGVPVIAFDRGAMREVVGDCGIIVPAGDVDALADAMAKPDLPSAARCRQRAVSRFSVGRMIDGYEQCYTTAIRAAALAFAA